MAANRAAIILAAGHGTRMRSSLSKVLHPVGGLPMLDHVIGLAKALDCGTIISVHGAHNLDVVARTDALLGTGHTALQEPALGTGHAVLSAKAALGDFEGDVIVLYADTPLITPQTAVQAFDALSNGASVAVLGFEAKDPGAYGRLIEKDGALHAIVEAKEASPEQLAVRLCNSGVLAAPAGLLFDTLAEVTNNNAKGEYYLTDVIALMVAAGKTAKAVHASEEEVLGVNSRVELAEAEGLFQARKRKEALLAGVTMIAPETVFFAYDTIIANDVVIEPNVFFGKGVKVETGTIIHSFSHLESCTIGAGAEIGPFARIRPGSKLGEKVKIGNFVELKNTKMGNGAKANHLTYLGDADVGPAANIGAGTITCNYDGYFKSRTEIGAEAFIGSDTMLVAPVRVGAGAITASGSTITKDVPDGAMAIERAELKIIDGAATRFRHRKAAEKAAKAAQKGKDGG